MSKAVESMNKRSEGRAATPVLRIDSTGHKYVPMFVELNGEKGLLHPVQKSKSPAFSSKAARRAELEQFFDWLLDPAYFLEQNSGFNKEVKSHRKRIARAKTKLAEEART